MGEKVTRDCSWGQGWKAKKRFDLFEAKKDLRETTKMFDLLVPNIDHI
jgi:hypothetical protein